jgi:hypothetical protein
VKSISGSEMNRKKRIVLKYPDGTYAHGKAINSNLVAIKDVDADSWMELKFNEDHQ